jgi:hypothetical protein
MPFQFIENNEVRALLGTLILIGSLVLFVVIIYKCAVCREEEDKKRIHPTQVIVKCPHCSNSHAKFQQLV